MKYHFSMDRISLNAKNVGFEAIHFESADPQRNVIFASGSGGNPERHLPLLESLASHGCNVIAPNFGRIVSPNPSKHELLARIDVLTASLDFLSSSSLPAVGVGHSIGATLLLALAGGKMWMREGESLSVSKYERLNKLVLFAPPTGYFQAPDSLNEVCIPIQVWSASLDKITPPEQIEVFQNGLPPSCLLSFQLVEGAGHFSFMNSLPPQIVDPMQNRERFLAELSDKVCDFVKD